MFKASSIRCPVLDKKIKKFIIVTKLAAVKLEVQKYQSNQLMQLNQTYCVHYAKQKELSIQLVVQLLIQLQQGEVYLLKIKIVGSPG